MSYNDQIIQDNIDYTLFSWSKQTGLHPLNIESAKGVYIKDRDGKSYIDFSSQLMNVNIGHGNQRITEAVAKQMAEVSYVYPGAATKARGDLGKMIAEITPGNLTKTFFTLGGAEANENAIKMARMVTGRTKIVGNYRSYHGATYAAISACGDPRKHPFDHLSAPGFIHVENPYFYRCPWGTKTIEECGEMALRNLEQVLIYNNPESVAAIIMEGESGTSGCIKYPPFYWKKVQELAHKYGILTISDEVMSGVGRTGKWFGVDHHDVTPDIMVVAKGITSGYLPLGGVVVTEEIANYFDDHPMVLGLTYSAHAVLCAAGVENLKIMHEENLVENAAKMGAYIEQEVDKLKDKHPSIGDFRNTGLLGCIELVTDRKTKEALVPFNAKASESGPINKIAAKIKELGMFTFCKWNYIFIAPPLIITKDQVDEGLSIIAEGLKIADEYYTGA
ncbi:MAG: aminotransferase class III-fold pyridoxal phosphate-dependent enzyme [Bacteroidetes bacterium]|nr:aminotransferase class III-fold pyridoxal phosphate-dependent enzyme [Bacteroidota bacterium]